MDKYNVAIKATKSIITHEPSVDAKFFQYVKLKYPIH